MSKAVENYRSYWDDFAEVNRIMAKKAKKVKPKKNMSPVVTGKTAKKKGGKKK